MAARLEMISRLRVREQQIAGQRVGGHPTSRQRVSTQQVSDHRSSAQQSSGQRVCGYQTGKQQFGAHRSAWAATMLATGLVFGLSACGLTAPRSNEGYADLDSLGPRDVDRTLSMSFGPTVLNLAARHLDDDPETRALVRGLEGVRIRIYEIDGDAGRVFERMEHMHAKLLAHDWQPILLVEEEGERAWMLVKASGERIVGLTVITASSHEAAVINVMGTLSPDMFNPTMAALSVDTRVEVASVN